MTIDPTTMDPPWTAEHCAAAEAEGWNIYYTLGSPFGRWQIQSNNENVAPWPTCDVDAWRIVATQAKLHHVAAADFIRAHNLEEFLSFHDFFTGPTSMTFDPDATLNEFETETGIEFVAHPPQNSQYPCRGCAFEQDIVIDGVMCRSAPTCGQGRTDARDIVWVLGQVPTPNWTTPVKCCPFCGGPDFVMLTEWSAKSNEDAGNTATLTEHQCEGACQGRSFWA